MITKRIFLIALLAIQSLALCAKDYNASLFGIKSDGTSMNTKSIQYAIDHISENGGGRLVFYVGRYLTGTISLKSNVTLHLEEGAILLGSTNPLDYDKQGWTSLVYAKGQKNIGITGKGVIDGRGREVANNFVALVHKGIYKDPLRYDRTEADNRPMLIHMRECEDVLIKHVTMKDAASWVQTYDQCKNLVMDSIFVDSKAFWNNDGIDIVDCENVEIKNSYVDASDDAICLKSHDDTKSCKNILIKNNKIRSSANGIKFGTASRGGFENVEIIDNTVFDTFRSAVALEAVDGGFLRNVHVEGLKIYNTGNAIFLITGERVAGRKATLDNISFNNVYAEITAEKPDVEYEYEGPVEDNPRNLSPAIIISGLKDAVISDVKFNNIEIKHGGGGNPDYANVPLKDINSIPVSADKYPEFSMFKELPSWAVFIRNAKNVQFTNSVFLSEKKDFRKAVVVDKGQNITFSNTKTNGKADKNEFFQASSNQVKFN